MLVNFEVGDEPPSVAAYRADGPKPPAADLTGIYARFPTGPSFDELAASTTAWLKANKPEVLDSKVEKAFRERGWLTVWTPPYCPGINTGDYPRNTDQKRCTVRMGKTK